MSDGKYTNLNDEVERLYALRYGQIKEELSKERPSKRRKVKEEEEEEVSDSVTTPVVEPSPLADEPSSPVKAPPAEAPPAETPTADVAPTDATAETPPTEAPPAKAPPAKKSVKSETFASPESSSRESSASASASSERAHDTTSPESTVDLKDPSPPKWYSQFKTPQLVRTRVPSSIDEVLNKLRAGMDSCAKAVLKGLSPSQDDLDKINDAVHKATFLQVTGLFLRKKRVLYNDTGLAQLFCDKHSRGVAYPWYIQEDAAELYTKWWSGNFSANLFHGINVGKKKNTRLDREAVSASLKDKPDNSPERRRGNFFGNGHLRNGQWWPSQLCAVRDGAHIAPVSGISGKAGEGTYSCVMSGGTYENIDNGNEVWYYGTEKEADEASVSTKRMIENVTNGRPVRLLRASKINFKNRFKPIKGIRYDGLYKVAGYEIKDLKKQVYLFHLVRLEGQGPIRYQGPEARPTREECEALVKAKIDKALLA